MSVMWQGGETSQLVPYYESCLRLLFEGRDLNRAQWLKWIQTGKNLRKSC
jgi:hypothetical protein